MLSESRRRLTVTIGLVAGAMFGLAGTFVSSDPLRRLAWGLDGTALVVATALLALYYFRRGDDLAAAGFLVFVAGESVILSGVAMTLQASVPSFVAGAALWAASLALVSASNAMPLLVRGFGFVAALLFAVMVVQILLGEPLTPLSTPLPFFAYPFLVATLLGWAWVHHRDSSR